MAAAHVHALGIGPLPSQATLGQPLDLSIPVRLEDSETLSAECIGADIHFGDNRQQPGVVNLALEPAPPGATGRVLRLFTNTRIDEPYVRVELTLGCQSKVVRRFTLFADPPLFTPRHNTTDAVEPHVAASHDATHSVAQAVASAPPVAPRAQRVSAEGDRATSAAMGQRPAAASKARPTARAAVPPSGPRLQLTPLDRSVRPALRQERASSLVAAAAAEVAASAAAAEARRVEEAASAAGQAQQDRARVEQLEASLQRLRAETAQTQQSMRGLQARVASAEAERFSNPLVFTLLFLVGMLLLGLVWLWRLHVQDRTAAAWLGGAPRDQDRSIEVDTAEAIAFAPASLPSTAVPAPVDATETRVSLAARVGGFDAESTQILPRSALPASLSPNSDPVRRAVSAEELIDLEQQAEFFIVLGQEEAAIDLLRGHLRSTSGTSPLPYLKLLEIYRKRGNRPEYERVRERFNMHFSAYAPDWTRDLSAGRTLEDYPEVMSRLQALWPMPSRALEVLQLTLARSDEQAQVDAGESFELPAYRELMLLYSVARELAEGGASAAPGGIDLLLPFGDEPGSNLPQQQVPLVERLTATTAVPAQPDARVDLHVDLPLDLSLSGAAETAAASASLRDTTAK
jgi:hypothetical protein